MNRENDGMRYPSIDELMKVTNSKYKLVIGAAKRARQIEHGSPVLLEKPYNKRSIGQALEEIVNKKIEVIDAKIEE